MALNPTFSDRQEYLVTVVIGQWERQDAEGVIDCVKAEAVRFNHKRILLDIRDVIPPKDPMARFWTGQYIAEHLLGMKTAVIWDQKHFDSFAETTAVNRGASIQVFFEEEDALEWLAADKSTTD